MKSSGSVRPSRRRDGTQGTYWISRARRYLRRYHSCQTDLDFVRLSDKYPDVFWAHHIWRDQNVAQRAAIEAQILAREDDYAIGQRCGIDPIVVTAYSELFFDVRSRLDHPSYIVNCVIGPELQTGLTTRDYPLLWKLYAYFMGPYMLEALETRFVNRMWCTTPEEVGQAVIKDAINTLKLKAAMAAKTVPVEEETQLALMEQFTKFIEVERTTESFESSENTLIMHIAPMLQEVALQVGGRLGTSVKVPGSEFDERGVELRGSERLLRAAGREVPDLKRIEHLRFPDDRGHGSRQEGDHAEEGKQ